MMDCEATGVLFVNIGDDDVPCRNCGTDADNCGGTIYGHGVPECCDFCDHREDGV